MVVTKVVVGYEKLLLIKMTKGMKAEKSFNVGNNYS